MYSCHSCKYCTSRILCLQGSNWRSCKSGLAVQVLPDRTSHRRPQNCDRVDSQKLESYNTTSLQILSNKSLPLQARLSRSQRSYILHASYQPGRTPASSQRYLTHSLKVQQHSRSGAEGLPSMQHGCNWVLFHNHTTWAD